MYSHPQAEINRLIRFHTHKKIKDLVILLGILANKTIFYVDKGGDLANGKVYYLDKVSKPEIAKAKVSSIA